MDVDTVVDKKPPQSRPKKLSRQERLDRDELEGRAPEMMRGPSVLRAELALKREVERAGGPRVRTADERRLEGFRLSVVCCR